jgi:uncharacterized membrane protein SirB2
MTNKTTENNEYFEFSKVTCASLRQTALLIAGAVVVLILGAYTDSSLSSWGNLLVLVLYFSLQFWCDLSSINFKNTKRLKTLLSVSAFILAVTGLVAVALVTKSGRVYDHIQWLIN